MSLKLASIEDQYKKCAELKKEDVDKLQEWIKKQPHLPNINELETIIFLHANYYNIEATKLNIDLYHTFRTHVPEFFGNRNVFGDDMQLAMAITMVVPLPGFTPDNKKVFYMKFLDCDPSKFIFADSLKLFIFAMDLQIMQEGINDGLLLVIDMTGLVFGHLTKLSLITMKKFLQYLQDAMPVRLKGLIYINIIPLIDKILAITRPLMKKELINMLELHPTIDTIIDKIPIEMLPNECGDKCKAGTFQQLATNYYEEIKKNSEFFKKEEQQRRVNEQLRPDKPKTSNDLFGIEGNFKKLIFD